MAEGSSASTDVKILLQSFLAMLIIVIGGYFGMAFLGPRIAGQQPEGETQPTVVAYEPPADAGETATGEPDAEGEASADQDDGQSSSTQPSVEDAATLASGAGRQPSGQGMPPGPGARQTAIALGTPMPEGALPGGRLPGDMVGNAPGFPAGDIDARMTAIAQGTMLPPDQSAGDNQIDLSARMTAIAQGTVRPGQPFGAGAATPEPTVAAPGESSMADQQDSASSQDAASEALGTAAQAGMGSTPSAGATPATAPSGTADSLADSTAPTFASRLFAVTRGSGAKLFDRPDGEVVSDLLAGSALTALARSDDGQWTLVQGSDGAGWIPVDQLVLFGAENLPILSNLEDAGSLVASSGPASGTAVVTDTDTGASSAQVSGTPAEDAGSGSPVMGEYINPVLATVTSQYARLNVRDGPGTTFDIVERVSPGEQLVALARTDSSDWVQVALPDNDEGAGWVSASFVELSDGISTLPVSGPSGAGSLNISLPTPTPSAVDLSSAAPANDAAGGEIAGALASTANVSGSEEGAEAVTLELHAGPSSESDVELVVDAGADLVELARSDDGMWARIAILDPPGGIGWVPAEQLHPDAAQAKSQEPGMVTEVTELSVSEAEDTSPASVASGALDPPDFLPVVGASQNADTAANLGGTLVFEASNGGQIYGYNLDTGALWPISTGFDPAISPDGHTVAFTRDGGEHGLYLVDIDGGNERLIFSGDQWLASPKWSPDGQWIVFSRGNDAYECVQAGPGGCRPVDEMGDRPLRDDVQTTTWINYFLSVVDRDGNHYHDLSTLESARAPDWTESGIVYQSAAGLQRTADEPNATTQLIIFDYLKPYFHDPDWQPGGGTIVYQGKEASHWEIFRVDEDGSGRTALTHPKTALVEVIPSNVAPAWNPDGDTIVFLSNRTDGGEAGEWRIWVMDADGANQRSLPVDVPLSYTFGDEQIVSWGPSI